MDGTQNPNTMNISSSKSRKENMKQLAEPPNQDSMQNKSIKENHFKRVTWKADKMASQQYREECYSIFQFSQVTITKRGTCKMYAHRLQGNFHQFSLFLLLDFLLWLSVFTANVFPSFAALSGSEISPVCSFALLFLIVLQYQFSQTTSLLVKPNSNKP